MRAELADFILSFERLNYREVDHIIKKLWITFEVAWEKERFEKMHADYPKKVDEYVNQNEKLLKDTFIKVMKSLALEVYEAKADALKEEGT